MAQLMYLNVKHHSSHPDDASNKIKVLHGFIAYGFSRAFRHLNNKSPLLRDVGLKKR